MPDIGNPSEYRVHRDVAMAMRDGVVLRGDIWLPAGPGPFAAVLFRTPYNKAGFQSDFLRPQQVAEAGMAAVIQDCRGCFTSDGNWRPFMWDQEGEDSYDTVEWIAAQDWCSGAVGMAGMSYVGVVQLAGAMLKPPHLKAIAPAICATAVQELAETGGAFWLDNLFGWAAFMTADWARKQESKGISLSEESRDILTVAASDPRALMDHRPLRESPLFRLPQFDIDFDELASTSIMPNYDTSLIEIPILATGGWYDLYTRGTCGLFNNRTPATERQMIMGPWAHSYSLPGYIGQANFSRRAGGPAAGVAADHLDFFRKHLLGEQVDSDPVRYFLMNDNFWHTSESWPPAGCIGQRLFIREGNRLSSDAPRGDETSDSYWFDPADPTPTLGGRTMPTCTTLSGPIDQRPLLSRIDVLRFENSPTEEATDIVGGVTADLFVSSSVSTFDIVVKLVDISPEGLALNITDGIKRLKDSKIGEVQRVEVSLADTAWRLRPGHRLCVLVQSGNYPHFDPNPGISGPTGSIRDGQRARIDIFRDGEQPSSIEFQVLQTS